MSLDSALLSGYGVALLTLIGWLKLQVNGADKRAAAADAKATDACKMCEVASAASQAHHEDITRRLDRIETKLDAQNGKR